MTITVLLGFRDLPGFSDSSLMMILIEKKYRNTFRYGLLNYYFSNQFNSIQTGIRLNTVNSEIFARILFLRIALKDIFPTLEIRDLGMIYVYQ